MGDTRYCTAFAHVILAGTSIWALRTLPGLSYYDDFKWAYLTFGLHLIRSTLGVFRFGNPEHGKKVRTLYDNTSYISIIFGFPCIATQLYLNYRYQANLAYLHVGLAVIPLVSFVFRKRRGIDWFLDLLLGGNILSVAFLSVLFDNYYGIAMSVCYAMNYFLIGSSGRVLELPAIDLFTHGTCFFNYFAIKALRD